MIEIIPAIIPKSYDDLVEHIEKVARVAKSVQIDITDGKFAGVRSWPHNKQDDNFERIINEEEGLPHWQDIEFEIDMMVSDPSSEIELWVRAGAARAIVHFESTTALAHIIETYKDVIDIGVAIGVDTPIDVLAPYISSIAFVQCMGISKIGYQGQAFDSRVLEQVKNLRAKYPELVISVDGGVTLETAPLLKSAGASRLVAGSAIFATENPIDAIRRLEKV